MANNKKSWKNWEKTGKKSLFWTYSYPCPLSWFLGQIWALFYAPIKSKRWKCVEPRVMPYWICDWGNLPWRKCKAEIFTLYLWNLYITVCRSYLSYTNQFHSISSSANHSMPFKKLCCCPFHSERGHGDASIKELFQTNYAEEKFCGIGWFSSSGHKEQKRKICIFCRDRIQLQRRCETLEVCCTDFLEIRTYCCSRSYCLNFSLVCGKPVFS